MLALIKLEIFTPLFFFLIFFFFLICSPPLASNHFSSKFFFFSFFSLRSSQMAFLGLSCSIKSNFLEAFTDPCICYKTLCMDMCEGSSRVHVYIYVSKYVCEIRMFVCLYWWLLCKRSIFTYELLWPSFNRILSLSFFLLRSFSIEKPNDCLTDRQTNKVSLAKWILLVGCYAL